MANLMSVPGGTRNWALQLALHGELLFFMAGFFSSFMLLSLFLNKKHYLLIVSFYYKAEAWKSEINQPVLKLINQF